MSTRAVRQSLKTSELLGVPFVPVREEIASAATSPETPAEATGAADPPSAPGSGSRIEALEALRREHDAGCPHCTTVTGHTQTVFGEGNPDADLMFVGEAPGAEEDRTGRPFVGRAGQKLEEMIRAMGLDRGDVYIANVLKSRPPDNRTPLADEIAGCAPYLAEQIRIIEPRVIVALGGPAAKFMLDTATGITKLRGTWAQFDAGGLVVDVMPTFHPAYLLRNYTRDTRERVWADLQAVLTKLKSE
ncbi:MAG: uracil-DNA glycosylase [Planctomycetes bacterium]|nr:uracil-DNA glycosylase [Planctomycetota bacterium]